MNSKIYYLFIYIVLLLSSICCNRNLKKSKSCHLFVFKYDLKVTNCSKKTIQHFIFQFLKPSVKWFSRFFMTLEYPHLHIPLPLFFLNLPRNEEIYPLHQDSERINVLFTVFWMGYYFLIFLFFVWNAFVRTHTSLIWKCSKLSLLYFHAVYV